MEVLYKDINLRDLGVMITKTNHLNLFERNLEIIKVPGRNSDLIYWDGSYNNIKLEIGCLMESENLEKIGGLLDYIRLNFEGNDYCELILYDRGEHQTFNFMAFFLKIKNIKKINNVAVEFVIEFTCKKGEENNKGIR